MRWWRGRAARPDAGRPRGRPRGRPLGRPCRERGGARRPTNTKALPARVCAPTPRRRRARIRCVPLRAAAAASPTPPLTWRLLGFIITHQAENDTSSPSPPSCSASCSATLHRVATRRPIRANRTSRVPKPLYTSGDPVLERALRLPLLLLPLGWLPRCGDRRRSRCTRGLRESALKFARRRV